MGARAIRTERTTREPKATSHLMVKFAVLSLVPLVLLGFVLAQTIKGQIRDRALEGAKVSAQVAARLGILPLLTPEDLQRGLSPERLRALDRTLRTSLIGQEVASIRIWAPDGRVVYSDDASLIGRVFEDNEELEEALEGEVESELFDPSKSSSDPTLALHERHGGLLEVYVPLVFDEQPAGAFELYLPYGPISDAVAGDTGKLYLLLGLGLLLLWLVLLPIAYRAGRVLRGQARRLKDLLSRERETVRRLRELDRMKSDFVSTASHELRSPLTAIIGFTRTLRQPEHADNVEIREEFLGRLERQGSRLLQLVDQLLEAARLQGAAGAEPQRELFDFVVLAHEVAGATDGEVEFRFDLPDDLGPMMGDRTLTGHVLSGLVENAVKHCPPGRMCTIGARADGDTFRFWVEDRGVGMTPEQIERAFEPFWQADSSSTRTAGGVGLGLYLVRQITTALKGDVSIDSEVGKRTRVTVALPGAAVPPVRSRLVRT
jgi:signal transduction histidine kinase